MNYRVGIVFVLGIVSLSLVMPASFVADMWMQDVVKLETTLIQVPVTVSEKGGRYVIDLGRDDFEIFEDGVSQEISFFQSIAQPFMVALVLDCSNSTSDQLYKIKEAAKLFIGTLRPEDTAMIVSFSDSVAVLCDLTNDRRILEEAIDKIEPGEYTQVYEAVYTVVWERLGLLDGRKAVILFTDGIDTASSEISKEDTLDAVIESEDVLIYPIRYNTREDIQRRLERSGNLTGERDIRLKLDRTYRLADEYLFRLAEESGGVLEWADGLADLPGALTRISKELRHQYLLGYYPRNPTVVGKRIIRVKVKRDGVLVRARPFYSR